LIIPLHRAYPSIYGAPVLDRVDSVIFTARYFRHCMACNFCYDGCCYYGADIDTGNVARVLARADEIEKFCGRARAEWFEPEIRIDPEYPHGAYTRTRVENGKCVFLQQGKRGCGLHAFSLAHDADYHDLKPMDCCLFPLTFDKRTLFASEEVEDGTLVCAGSGATLYQGARAELEFYFGAAMIAELDARAEAFAQGNAL